MSKFLIAGIGLLALLLGLHWYKQRKLNKEHDKLYSEFLKSNKYKVKGQFD